MFTWLMRKLKNLKKEDQPQAHGRTGRKMMRTVKILRKVRRGTIRAILEILIFRFYRAGKTIPESERGRQISLLLFFRKPGDLLIPSHPLE
jgi:hypothetical protein